MAEEEVEVTEGGEATEEELDAAAPEVAAEDTDEEV